MHKLVENTFFFQALLCLTISENGWSVFGYRLEVICYFVLIVQSIYLCIMTSRKIIYFYIIIIIIFILYFCKAIENIIYYKIAYSSFFILTGLLFYSKNIEKLLANICAYLALCIPIMIAQIIGLHYFFFGWVTDYLHDPDIMLNEDIGKFNKIPLFPTLFVELPNLMYAIGQGRPAGMMYAANVIGIFIALAIVLNICIKRTKYLNYGDIVISVCSILAMSKFVYLISILYYSYFILFGESYKRILILKILILNIIFLFIYYIFFPGLFENNLSSNMVFSSFLIRIADIMSAIGFNVNEGYISAWLSAYPLEDRFVFIPGYFSLGNLIQNIEITPSLFGLIIFIYFYYLGYKNMKFSCYQRGAYLGVLLLIPMILLSFSFLNTATIYIILGFSISPLLSNKSLDFFFVTQSIQSK